MKKNTVKSFVEHKLKDQFYFSELKNRIERKIDGNDISSLYVELRELEIYLKYVNHSFYKTSTRQLILLVNSVILYEHEKKHRESLSTLIEATKLTIPNFELENYRSFVYNSLEIRLLMNMAFVLNRLNESNKYIEILEFCTDTVDDSDNIYPKLCHNLSSAYIRNREFQKSLDYSNLAIESAQDQENYNGLYILFYGKGLSEFYLEIDDYKRTFKTCLSLCDAFGQFELKETFMNNLKDELAIDVEMLEQ